MTTTAVETNDTSTIGIREWGSKPASNNSSWGREELPRLPFFQLKSGVNRMRIITNYAPYYQIRFVGPNSKRSFGDRVRTAYPTYPDCPAKNELGKEPKERYFAVVIDREDGALKLFDMGPLVFDQVEGILQGKNDGRKDSEPKVTPLDFDLIVKFNPKSPKPTGYHIVSAKDNSPMTADDLAAIRDIGGEEMLNKILARQVICPKPETVRKRLLELGWDGKPASKEDSDEALEAPKDDDYSFDKPAS